MKKVFLVILALMSVWLMASCSGARDIVRNNGDGGVDVDWLFRQQIDGNNPDLPYYFSADTNWLRQGKLKPSVAELEEDEGSDYGTAPDMEGKPFQVFQVEEDSLTGDVIGVLWVADITAVPTLKLLREGLAPENENEDGGETVAGMPIGKVVEYRIRAVPMDENFDDYWNVDDRYAQDSRWVMTWDKDAFPNVDEVWQFDLSNQDGVAPIKLPVAPGSNRVAIDSRKGKYSMLYRKGSPAMAINDWKREDLKLEGLDLEKLNGKYYLKLKAMPILKPLSLLLKEEQENSRQSPKAKFHRYKARHAHYTLKQKYPDGYYRADIKDIKCDDSDLYRLCVLAGKISKGQKEVIIGKNYLRANGSKLLRATYVGKEIIP